jgi:membrane protein implicated in regulation of membrane protease activity
MDAVTGTFLLVGGFALLLLVLSLFGGHMHVGHVHLGHLHAGHGVPGSPDGGTAITLPAIAGFLGTFGFGGAFVVTVSGASGRTAALLAATVGLCLGVPAAWLANRLMAAAVHMPTDATLTSADLVGALGVVITPVPAGGLGEVRLAVAGQQMKFHARADRPLARGTAVFVVEVPSPTSVLVEPTPGAPAVEEGS